jgi:hypothetical protein
MDYLMAFSWNHLIVLIGFDNYLLQIILLCLESLHHFEFGVSSFVRLDNSFGRIRNINHK